MNRYFFGFLVAIGLIILIVILIFSGGGKPSTKAAQPAKLPSYANTDAVVRMTIDGPITAVQSHNSVQVTVVQNSSTLNLIQGYDGNVIKSKTYPNTLNSYSAFLYSLYYSGYSEGSNAADLSNDVGFCPSGNRYVFELIQNGKDIQRYWTTNCGGSTPKSYNGNIGQTINLFQAQIPDYNVLTQGANI